MVTCNNEDYYGDCPPIAEGCIDASAPAKLRTDLDNLFPWDYSYRVQLAESSQQVNVIFPENS